VYHAESAQENFLVLAGECLLSFPFSPWRVGRPDRWAQLPWV